MRFRRHSIEQLQAMAPFFRDESKLTSLARAGRAQLEQLFAQERAEQQAAARPTWDIPQADDQPFDEVAGAPPRAVRDEDATPEH